MDGIRVRMRSHAKISILNILVIKALHDVIRDFARDTTAPTPSCRIVRAIAARIKTRGLWDNYFAFAWTTINEADGMDGDTTEWRGEQWYVKQFLRSRFRLEYNHGRALVRVKHFTVADEDDYKPEVKDLVLRLERAAENRNQGLIEFRTAVQNRFHAWQRRVQGHSWAAACTNGWKHHSIEAIEADEDLRSLWYGSYVWKEKGQRMDHIIDVGTLTLLHD